jgi:hypothetical protein
MAKDKRSKVSVLAGFYEDMERTNTEKITSEILARLSEDSEAVMILMLILVQMMLKIGHGGQAMLSPENLLSRKDRLR